MTKSDFLAKELHEYMKEKGYGYVEAQFPAVIHNDDTGKMEGAYITEGVMVTMEELEKLRTTLANQTYHNKPVQDFLDRNRAEVVTAKLMEQWSKEKNIKLD